MTYSIVNILRRYFWVHSKNLTLENINAVVQTILRWHRICISTCLVSERKKNSLLYVYLCKFFYANPSLGQDLFTSLQGKIIQINPNVSSTSIPCSVSHPSAQVSLYKLDGVRHNLVRFSKFIDPHTHFRRKFSKLTVDIGNIANEFRCNYVGMEFNEKSNSRQNSVQNFLRSKNDHLN